MAMEVRRRKTQAALVSIVSNCSLTAIKLFAAIISGSVSALSEAIHSCGDVIASLLAWISVRVSDKPADEEHPFGHGKAESLAGLAEACLLVVAGCYVFYEAVQRVRKPEPLDVGLAFWAILATGIVNIFVSRFVRRVAVETDSDALRADAAHLTADVVTTAGVLVGLGLVWWTDNHLFDSLVALLLTVWIFWTAIRIGWKSSVVLLDSALPENEIAIVRNILELHSKILGFHQLRTRKSGSHRHIDAHIQLDDEFSLVEAHEITEEIEDQIRDALPNVSIALHMEPYRWEIAHRAEKHKD